ncbi:hypothetical protein [Clostridium felsineum]|uniref:Uncharacterized protein n=1 Tax=Clostridium felsineum TaxID=36839 RepID=A0A1S8LWG9_9CLOT|nr:hypothetical protein [Clostridium felsineum]URZ03526.1 hypothetical protein CLAUR_035870 [Clostridium felsineum]URZ08157.1 hypothetical protein CLROS_035230 [Clostridium felsineum]URZ13188.1 hypothetical protein CROST_039380 [Clostridium felsineum]URZ14831.1 hypothetical protein CLFE_008440 [Clostridium felsineum DSM 794]
MKKKFLNKKTAFIIFMSILSCVLVFSVTYNLFIISYYRDYEHSIETIASSINTANNISSSFDIKNTKTNVTKSINLLIKAQNHLNKLHEVNKYKYVVQDLKTGLSGNILAYKQLILCINNSEDPNISTSIHSLDKYRNSCLKQYSRVNCMKKDLLKIDKFIDLIYNSKHYFSEKEALKKYNTVSSEEVEEFTTNFSTMVNEFKSILTNFDSYAENARNKKISYTYVINKIEQSQNALDNFEQNLNTLSIPQSKLEVFSSLKKAMNDYKAYIKSFLPALTYEENSSDTYISTSEVNKLYSDSNYKFKQTEEDLKEFNKLFR